MLVYIYIYYFLLVLIKKKYNVVYMYFFYCKFDFKKILFFFGVNYFLDDKIVMDILNIKCFV